MSFLNLLDKLRANGRNRWRSICPCCGGKNATALSIVQWDNGSFGAHCFKCEANGMDVFNALGLPPAELNGFKEFEKKSNYITQMQKDEYKEDKFFVEIYNAGKERGETIALSDHKRYKLSVNRMAGIEQIMNLS